MKKIEEINKNHTQAQDNNQNEIDAVKNDSDSDKTSIASKIFIIILI